MTTKPEDVFKSSLAKAYPGMSGEMRRGIVGIAIRSFLTPGEIGRSMVQVRSEYDREQDNREWEEERGK